MHELSLAQSIADLALSEARKRNATGIKTIKLRLGEFTGLGREALEFGFAVVARGTPAAAAALEIEVIPLTVRCTSCNTSPFPAETFCFICTTCGAPAEIVTGTEMLVEYVELLESQV
jgi:hydrogenase nickel incorporation protein HypA/HybF